MASHPDGGRAPRKPVNRLARHLVVAGRGHLLRMLDLRVVELDDWGITPRLRDPLRLELLQNFGSLVRAHVGASVLLGLHAEVLPLDEGVGDLGGVDLWLHQGRKRLHCLVAHRRRLLRLVNCHVDVIRALLLLIAALLSDDRYALIDLVVAGGGDVAALRLVHELLRHEGAVPGLEYALLLVAVLVGVLQIVAPVRVGRVGLRAQLLLLNLDDRVQEACLLGLLLPEDDRVVEVSSLGEVVEVGLLRALSSEAAFDVVRHRDKSLCAVFRH